jgi:hypothetical protein
VVLKLEFLCDAAISIGLIIYNEEGYCKLMERADKKWLARIPPTAETVRTPAILPTSVGGFLDSAYVTTLVPFFVSIPAIPPTSVGGFLDSAYVTTLVPFFCFHLAREMERTLATGASP